MDRKELTELRERRAEIHRKMTALFHGADAEGRNLSKNESEAYDRLDKQFRSVDGQIAAAEGGEGLAGLSAEEREQAFSRAVAADRRVGISPTPATKATVGATLTRSQAVSDWAGSHLNDGSGFSVRDADEFCIGNIMRALVEPSFRKDLTDVEQRVLAEGVDATGGFITPEILSLNFIDKVRNATRVMQAGATTVPLDSDKQSIPRLSGDPTFAWRNENAVFSESQPAFERVTFTPQSGGFIVRTSEELYQDAIPEAGRAIENAIVATAALELDRVALRGSGTAPEPRGIRNQAGVTIQSLGVNGATPTYANAMTAVSTLLTANRDPNAWLMAPRTSQTYAGLTDTTGQPLNPPQPVADLDKLVTSQVPINITQGTSTDTSEIYVGQWTDLMIGIRLGVQLRLLTERYADSGQYAWRVFLRADVQLAHPESFVVMTGVRP